MLWPEVSSKPARRLIQAAYDRCPHFLGKYDGDYLISPDTRNMPSASLLSYRERLRKVLRSTDLAELLPGGMDMLTVPEDILPGWYLPLFKTYRPRSYEQLIGHLGVYLPCYLRMPEAQRISASITSSYVVGLVIGAAAIGVLAVFHQWLALAPTLVFVLCLVNLLSFAGIGQTEYRNINLAELHFYLRECYADRTDEEAAKTEMAVATRKRAKLY